jgi:hypothetical protein
LLRFSTETKDAKNLRKGLLYKGLLRLSRIRGSLLWIAVEQRQVDGHRSVAFQIPVSKSGLVLHRRQIIEQPAEYILQLIGVKLVFISGHS